MRISYIEGAESTPGLVARGSPRYTTRSRPAVALCVEQDPTVALANWPGALVVATHDRRLQDALGLEREVAL